MATCKIQCAISGLHFHTSFLGGEYIPASAGYFHPVFAAPYTQLHTLYSKHCKGKLDNTDSYLLFLAFAHSSGKIEWECPATLSPHSSFAKKLVENNITQLVTSLEKSACIRHPSFSQPDFRVRKEGADLQQLPNWIKELEENIEDFYTGKATMQEIESLQKVENKLSYLILSGEKPEKFAHVIADWADKAAEFPSLKTELYKKTIRSCFNMNKMFNTPLALLQEIKDYCECNIEAGSIHFHTLTHVLKEGIRRHTDYLGGSSLALGYTILPSLEEAAADTNPNARPTLTYAPAKQAQERELAAASEINNLAASAPTSYPKAEDYETELEFLKAKLAFRLYSTIKKGGNFNG